MFILASLLEIIWTLSIQKSLLITDHCVLLCPRSIRIFDCLFFGPHLCVLRANSWLFTQGTLLAVFRAPQVVAGIDWHIPGECLNLYSSPTWMVPSLNGTWYWKTQSTHPQILADTDPPVRLIEYIWQWPRFPEQDSEKKKILRSGLKLVPFLFSSGFVTNYISLPPHVNTPITISPKTSTATPFLQYLFELVFFQLFFLHLSAPTIHVPH